MIGYVFGGRTCNNRVDGPLWDRWVKPKANSVIPQSDPRNKEMFILYASILSRYMFSKRALLTSFPSPSDLRLPFGSMGGFSFQEVGLV